MGVNMSKAIVIYASTTGETQSIAVSIAQGIRESGHEAKTRNINNILDIKEIEDHNAVVLGSSVYKEEVLPEMKTLLHNLKQANLQDKVGGAFASFEWSENAPDEILVAMQNLHKMDTMENCLKLRPPFLGNQQQEAVNYGKEIGKRMG